MSSNTSSDGAVPEKVSLLRTMSDSARTPDRVPLARRMSNEGVDLGPDDNAGNQMAGSKSPPKPDADMRIWGAKFCLTGLSAMAAESATYPIDIAKTRMQLHGEGVAGQRVSFIGAASTIVKQEGFTGLYSGVTPAIARHVPYTGTRVILYEYLRGRFTKEGEKPPFFLRLGMGFTAGGTAQVLAVPMDLIKVRMQADGRLVASGELSKPRYTGLLDALRKSLLSKVLLVCGKAQCQQCKERRWSTLGNWQLMILRSRCGLARAWLLTTCTAMYCLRCAQDLLLLWLQRLQTW